MARLAPLSPHEFSRSTRFWLWLQRRLLGRVLRPYPIIARSPRLVTAVTWMNTFFSTGEWVIGPQLRTLIHLRVAAIVGCVF